MLSGLYSMLLLDVSEYESLVERLDLLTDIQMGESQVNKGDGLSHEAANKVVLGTIKR